MAHILPWFCRYGKKMQTVAHLLPVVLLHGDWWGLHDEFCSSVGANPCSWTRAPLRGRRWLRGCVFYCFGALSSYLIPVWWGEGRGSPAGNQELHRCMVERCSPRGEGRHRGGSSSAWGHGRVNHPDPHLGTKGDLLGKAALFCGYQSAECGSGGSPSHVAERLQPRFGRTHLGFWPRCPCGEGGQGHTGLDSPLQL